MGCEEPTNASTIEITKYTKDQRKMGQKDFKSQRT